MVMILYGAFISQVVDKYAAGAFVIGWILFGSYIIGNMFIGILVNNFTQIRKDLMEEVGSRQVWPPVMALSCVLFWQTRIMHQVITTIHVYVNIQHNLDYSHHDS